jgi:CheY-like chemotaxis protein
MVTWVKSPASLEIVKDESQSQMIHVLIVDEDATFAERLSKALNQLTRACSVTYVATTVEARIFLASQPQDLAFVPSDPQGEVMQALRAIQPDLRLVLTAPTLDYDLPEIYAGHVQGVLIRPLLVFDLEEVVHQALAQPVTPALDPGATRQRHSNGHWADSSTVIEALQKVDLGELVKTAVFTRGARLIGYWGRLTDAEATAVAQHIGHTWSNSDHRIQIQFLHLPAHSGDLLLYTRYIIDRFLLTLVSLPETPVNELRRRADQLAEILRDTLAGEPISLTNPLAQETERTTYAVVWRPVNSLPTALHIPLRRIIERLAAANGCVLTYIKVQSELVHLVVNCPPERRSSWVVVLFKNGTEEAIQQEYGLVVNLWESGYYAEERDEPLAEAELRVFLEGKAITSGS